MSLSICPECARDIREQAYACPKCGVTLKIPGHEVSRTAAAALRGLAAVRSSPTFPQPKYAVP